MMASMTQEGGMRSRDGRADLAKDVLSGLQETQRRKRDKTGKVMGWRELPPLPTSSAFSS